MTRTQARPARWMLGLVAGVAFGTLAWLALTEPAAERRGRPGRPSPEQEAVVVPAGRFWMGVADAEAADDEHPRHEVYLDAFLIDRYEVTVGQYRRCVENGGCSAPTPASARGPLGWKLGVGCNWENPARGEDYPVNCVDWHQADAYCTWAGKRLPTEVEWEKAARGGTDTRYSFGDAESLLPAYAWFSDNAVAEAGRLRHVAARYLHLGSYVLDFGGLSHPVGHKKPNPLGLHDVHGNVWEWVADGYGADYYARSPERNPRGPSEGTKRVVRGGAWSHPAGSCRSAHRWRMSPEIWYDIIGFRCASSAAAAD